MNTLRLPHFSIQYLCLVLMILLGSKAGAQNISPALFGQNIWLDKLNVNGTYINVGQMNNLWDDLDRANIQLMRAGGIHYDENIPPNWLYLEWVDKIIAINAEPMVQISRKSTAQQAKDLVTYLNVTNGRKVKYWIIGNEPDWHWNVNTPTTDPNHVFDAGTIRDYIKTISSAIKSIDPTIKVVGPECAWMNQDYLPALLGGWADITGKDANGNYYLDVASYHQYNDPTAAAVEAKMNTFLGYLATANNARPAGQKLEWAITEFNITTGNNKETALNKAWSFYAGQYFAEVFGLAMKKGALSICPWSVQESDGARTDYDLGMFDTAPNLAPRSSYHHMSLLSNHFSGTYAAGSTNKTEVTAFGCVKGNGYAVVLINKGATTYNVSLRLDQQAIAGTADLNVNINANAAIAYYDVINGNETLLLDYDASGTLIKRCHYTATMAAQPSAPVCQTIAQTQTSYGNAPWPIPGKIEVEAYDNGKQQVSYNDYSRGNTGAVFRTDDVDIEACTDNGGGYNIAYVQAGEWLEYSVNVATTGNYKADVRVASLNGNGGLSLAIDGSNILDDLTIASTTGWQTWATLNTPVYLTAGQHVLRLKILRGEFNLNWMDFQLTQTTDNLDGKANKETLLFYPNPVSKNLTLSQSLSWEVHTLLGECVQKGEGESINMEWLENGVYFIKTREYAVFKIIKQ